MANLIEFKKSIENFLKIHDWRPTEQQIEIIRQRFERTPPKNLADALGIVRSVYGPTRHYVLDGIDNSDLRVALALAIAAARA